MKDIYQSMRSKSQGLDLLKNDSAISKQTRKLATEWLKQKEIDLSSGRDKKEMESDGLRIAKTITKYSYQIRNFCRWIPSPDKLTLEQLEKFKVDLFEGKLLGLNGRATTSAGDYVKKIIRGRASFLTFIGKQDFVEKVFIQKIRKKIQDPDYITEEDLRLLCRHIHSEHKLVAMHILFYGGLRIGELLHLRVNDFELISDTMDGKRTSVYHIHVRKETSKSKDNRTVPITDEKTVDLFSNYIKAKKDDDFLFPYSYQVYDNAIKDSTASANVYCSPRVNEKRPVHLHVLRKSATVYLINAGYDITQVKMILGHKPSSTEIDVYLNMKGVSLKPSVNNQLASNIRKEKEELDSAKRSLARQISDMEEVKREMMIQKKEMLALQIKMMQKFNRK